MSYWIHYRELIRHAKFTDVKLSQIFHTPLYQLTRAELNSPDKICQINSFLKLCTCFILARPSGFGFLSSADQGRFSLTLHDTAYIMGAHG